MPLEIKHHTVPHLKGLNSGMEPKTSCGRGRTFLDTRQIWKYSLYFIKSLVSGLFCSHLYFSQECIYIYAKIRARFNWNIGFYGLLVISGSVKEMQDLYLLTWEKIRKVTKKGWKWKDFVIHNYAKDEKGKCYINVCHY